MQWEQLPINTTFDKARRQEVFRRVADLVTGKKKPDTLMKPETLMPLDDVKRSVRLFDQTYRGIMPIPVAKIIGTAGSASDFGKDFLPLKPEARERWMRVERSFAASEFPPIVVFQVGDGYFVVDGHHRVAIAKQRGVEYIDAEVTELRARFEVPPGADIGELICAEQRQRFMEESGLARARADADIDFSRPDRYVELLELVKVHGYHLMVERDEILPIEEIAADFYDRVYLPTIEVIRDEKLAECFQGLTEADLFMLVHERRRALFPEFGRMGLEDIVVRTKKEGKGARARRKQKAQPG